MAATRTKTGRCETGYCWLCLLVGTLEQVEERFTSGRLEVGWVCPRCGGVSMRPYKVCPQHGRSCREHLPLDEEVC